MKRVRQILVWAAILLGVLIVGLAALVAFDYAAGRDRIDAVTNVTIPGLNGSPDVRAYVAKPEGEGPFPTVIMIHEFFGLNEDILSKADLLAEDGFLVIAPDTFRGSTTSLIPRAIYQVISTKTEDVNVDLDSVYAWLESQPDVDPNRIAVLGFCYGGRASLAYSLHNDSLAATIIFYGFLETDPEILSSLPGPVLGIFGGADQSIPVEDVNAFEQGLEAAGIPHQISIYEGQPHAFVRGADEIKAGGAQGEAWNEMLEVLEVNFKEGAVRNRNGDEAVYLPSFDFTYYLTLVFEHAFGSASYVH
ncbi:MAG TPA: dienelactone hydrolase family protein [Anaerolineales bacterium]|nr:dienelactone hydrolase family protein [Anaerolineales bacterium]